MDLSVIENDPEGVKEYMSNFVPINYYRVLGDEYLYQVRASLLYSVSGSALFSARYEGMFNEITISVGENSARITDQQEAWADLFSAGARRTEVLEAHAVNATAAITEIREVSASQNKAQASINTNLQASLDDIIVGGRNLIVNSTFTKGYESWGAVNIVESDHYIGTMHRMNSTGEGAFGISALDEFKQIKMIQGNKYSLSFYGFGSVTLLDEVYLESADGTLSKLQVIEMSTDLSERRHIVFTAPIGGNDIGFVIGASSGTAEDWFSVSLLKLEIGTRATDWTPAPEDVDGYISSVQSSIDEFKEVQVTRNEATALTILAMDSRIGENSSQIVEERETNATKFGTLTQTTKTLEGRTGANEGRIEEINTITTDKYETVVSKLNTLEADSEIGKGKITNLETITANNEEVIASTTNNLSARIDGIDIGGRNLLRNSDFRLGYKLWGTAAAVETDNILGNLLTITNVGDDTTYFGIEPEERYQTINIVAGKSYVLSFYAEGSIDEINDIWVRGTGNGAMNLPNAPITTSLGVRTELVFIADFSATNGSIIIGANGAETNDWFAVTAIKLEQGNKATDWTAAPEDTGELIDTVTADITEFKRVQVAANEATAETIDTLSATVGENTAEISRVSLASTTNKESIVATKEVLTAKVDAARGDFTDALEIVVNDVEANAQLIETLDLEFENNKVEYENNFTAFVNDYEATVESVDALKTKTDKSSADIIEIKNAKSASDKAFAEDITNLTATFNNIALGGENLLLDTKLMSEDTSSINTGKTKFIGFGMITKYTTNITDEYVTIYRKNVDVLEGESEHVFSCWVWTGGANTEFQLIFNPLGTSEVNTIEAYGSQGQIKTSGFDGLVTFNIKGTTPQRVWIKWKSLSSIAATKLLWVRLKTATSASVTWFAKPKLELGNQVTDWSPAPQDALTYTDGSINQVVEMVESKADISRVDTVESDANQSIAAAETRITGEYTATINTAVTSLKKYSDDVVGDIKIGGGNLINHLDEGLIVGKYLNSTGGESIAASWRITAYIDVYASTQYVVTGINLPGATTNLVFYDNGKKFISATKMSDLTGIAVLETPSNAAYIRLSFSVGDTNTVQLEKGNTPTAYAKSNTDYYLSAISSVNELEDEITTSFRDGIISETEAISIKSEINQITVDKNSLNERYAVVYNNAALLSTAKTNLSTAMSAYNTAFNNLVSYITSSISDSAITTGESNEVEFRFSEYQTAIKTLSKRFEEAAKYISNKLTADALTAAMEYTDTEINTVKETVNSKADISRVDTVVNDANQAIADATVVITGEYTKLVEDTTVDTKTYAALQASEALKAAKADAQIKKDDAIKAANEYALAEAEAADLRAQVYADGIVSEAEELLLEDSVKKLAEAKVHANTTADAAKAAALLLANQYTDAIEIGGRNLIRETTDYVMTNSRGEVGGNTALSKVKLPLDTIEAETTYTLSFLAKQTSNLRGFNIYFINFDGNGHRSKRIALTTEYERYVFTFTTPSIVGSDATIRFDNLGSDDNNTAVLYATKLKLEKGTKATDWTVAPEDLINYIDSKITTVNTSISSKADITTVNQIVNDANKAIAEAKVLLTGEYTKVIETTITDVQTYAREQAEAALELAKENASDKAIEAINSAKEYSEAQAEAAETRAAVYADGIVDESEELLLADSVLKLSEAKKHAEDSAIAAEAAAIEASNKYTDLIEIGGVNLLPDSRDLSSYSSTIDEYYRGTRILAKANTSGNYADGFNASIYGVGGSKYLTISFYAKADAAITIGNYLYQGDSPNISSTTSQGNTSKANDGSVSISLSTNWERYWITYEKVESDDYKRFIVGRMYVLGVTVYLTAIKIEKGNKATEWSPAPEDIVDLVDSEISRVTTIVDSKASSERVDNIVTDADGALVDAKNELKADYDKQISDMGLVLDAKASASELTTVKGDAEEALAQMGIDLTAAFTVSDNLFSLGDCLAASELAGDYKVNTPNHQYMQTYIPLSGSSTKLAVQVWNPNKLTSNNTNRISFYAEDKTYISSGVNMQNMNGTSYVYKSVSIPANAKWIRIGVVVGVTDIDPAVLIKVEEGDPTPWKVSGLDINSNVASLRNESTTRATELEAMGEITSAIDVVAKDAQARVEDTEIAISDLDKALAESSSSLEAKFSKLKFGGNNLLLQSRLLTGQDALVEYTGGSGIAGFNYLFARLPNDEDYPTLYRQNVPLEVGETEHTFSCYLWTGGASSQFQVIFNPLGETGRYTEVSIGSQGQYSTTQVDGMVTFTLATNTPTFVWVKWVSKATVAGNKLLWVRLNGLTSSAINNYMTKPMLVSGSVVADWSPAADDIELDITNNEALITTESKTRSDQYIAMSNRMVNVESKSTDAASAITRIDKTISGNTQSVAESLTTLKAETAKLQGTGTNLIPNSKDMEGEPYRTDLYYGGFSVLAVNGSRNNLNYENAMVVELSDLLAGNYVLSFYAKANKSTNDVRCYFYAPNSTTSAVSSTGQTSNKINGEIDVTLTTEWQKYWIKWTHTPSEGIKRLVIGRSFGSVVVNIAAPMFTEGVVIPAWQDSLSANIEETKKAVATVNGLSAQWSVKLDINGYISGITQYNDGVSSQFVVQANVFKVVSGTNLTAPFKVVNGTTYLDNTIIKDGDITNAKIASLAVTSAKIASLAVDNSKIANLAVTNGKIAALAVDTLQIAGNAVTVAGLFYSEQEDTFNIAATESEVAVVTINPAGGSVAVSFGFETLTVSDYGDRTGATLILRLKRDSTVLRTIKFTAARRTGSTLYENKIIREFVTFATMLDSPPTGSRRYAVTAQTENTNEDEITLKMKARSLMVSGAKK